MIKKQYINIRTILFLFFVCLPIIYSDWVRPISTSTTITGNASSNISVNNTEGFNFLDLTVQEQLKVRGDTAIQLSGSIDTDQSDRVQGYNTKFLSEVEVGDILFVGAQIRIITNISSDTILFVEKEFADQANDSSIFKYHYITKVIDYGNNTRQFVTNEGELYNYNTVRITDTSDTGTNDKGLELYHGGVQNAQDKGMGVRWFVDRNVSADYQNKSTEVGAIIVKRATSDSTAPSSMSFWFNPGGVNGYNEFLRMVTFGNLPSILINPTAALDFGGFVQYNGAWTMYQEPYTALSMPQTSNTFVFNRKNNDLSFLSGQGHSMVFNDYVSGAYYGMGTFSNIISNNNSVTSDWQFKLSKGGVNGIAEVLRLSGLNTAGRVGINCDSANNMSKQCVNATLQVLGESTNVPVGLFRAASGQTANIFEVQNITGFSLVNFSNGGHITLGGNATYWEDVQPYAQDIAMGATSPSLAAYQSTGFRWYKFTNNPAGDEEMQFSFQLPHKYKEGTNVHFHIHVIPSQNGTGGNNKTVWKISYQWINTDSKWSQTTNTEQSKIFTVGTNDADRHLLWEFTELNGTGKTKSSDLSISVKRLTQSNSTDDYTGDIWLKFTDIHIEADKMGSDDET